MTATKPYIIIACSIAAAVMFFAIGSLGGRALVSANARHETAAGTEHRLETEAANENRAKITYSAEDRKRLEAKATEDAATQTLEPKVAALPDHTPLGIPVEKNSFYLPIRMGVITDENALLELTDAAVAMARLVGLRCDSVTMLKQWTFTKGWTLQCNRWDYKYYLEDKGRGTQIRIAE